MARHSSKTGAAVAVVSPSHLLGLPTELRVMILKLLCDTIPRNDGCLRGSDGHWLPPPIMQTCHQLRIDGLPIFIKLEPLFTIVDFAMDVVCLREQWCRMIESYYDLNCTAVGSTILVLRPSSMELALPNLEAWLREFYLNNMPGLLLRNDFPDKIGNCDHWIEDNEDGGMDDFQR